MRYWFCVTNPYNWLIVKQNKIWGVDYRYKTTIKDRVSEGDMLVFYVLQNMKSGLKRYIKNSKLTDQQLRELELVRGCFIGIWKISSQYFEDNIHIGWVNRDGIPEAYPHRRRISLYMEPQRPVPLNPNTEIFKELVFITDKTRSWYNILYSSMTLISYEDLQIFQRFCK
ncbi:MAG: EVE domain-containing protein [Nitrososphaerales archaeon]